MASVLLWTGLFLIESHTFQPLVGVIVMGLGVLVHIVEYVRGGKQ